MDSAYKSLLKQVKEQIINAQVKAVSASNKQMLYAYWQLGHLILFNQSNKGWGAKVIDLLSADLRKEMPNLKGFSVRNLKYMRKFAYEYPYFKLIEIGEISKRLKLLEGDVDSTQKWISDFMQQPVAQIDSETLSGFEIVQQPVAQLNEEQFTTSVLAAVSWSHHIILMDKEPQLLKRIWYMHNAIEHGSSRNILAFQVESGLFERQVTAKKTTNFSRTLPPSQSDFANYLLKDPYIFDFIQAKEKVDERNIEEQLASHITKFLLELGKGFAFVGRQMRFEVGNQDFFADLVFYHIRLKCYVIVELKAREFEPGDASQLNFYVNLANDQLKGENDNETIGLLLCKGKNDIVAEYSLKGMTNALGVSNYHLSKVIPNEMKSELPQIEDIEIELKELNESSKE